jgi:DNA-binding NtrC family response regulator
LTAAAQGPLSNSTANHTTDLFVAPTRMEYLLAKAAGRMVRARVGYDLALEMFRRSYLLAQLEAHGWNKAAVAATLKMAPATVDCHCAQAGIEIPSGLRKNRRAAQ